MYTSCLWDRQERSALPATGWVPRRLDPRGLRVFLAQGSLPAERTLVEGVCALPPGGRGIWQEGRWQASYAPEAALPYPDLAAYTRQALEASVPAHLLADVPVGLFLSDGLDSAAVLALVGRPLTTLTIGFAERAFDESEPAAALARHFGAEHHDLPLGAAELGLKVVLSGLRGDELFGGYPSFARVPRAWALHLSFEPLAPLGAAWLSRSRRAGAQRLAAGLRRPASIDNTYFCLRGLFAPTPRTSRATQPRPIVWPGWRAAPKWSTGCCAMPMPFGLELRLPLVNATLLRALASQPAGLEMGSWLAAGE